MERLRDYWDNKGVRRGCLRWAINNRDEKMIREIINLYPDLIWDNTGGTAPCEKLEIAVVRDIIENINFSDELINFLVAKLRQLNSNKEEFEYVEKEIVNGYIVSRVKSLVEKAIKESNLEEIEFLIERFDFVKPLEVALEAIKQNRFWISQYIAEKHKIEIHMDNNNLLRKAVVKKDIQAVRWLISKGVDVNTGEDSVLRPILEASEHFCSEIIKLLVDAGADMNVAYDYIRGRINPLVCAIKHGDVELVKYLIEKGAKFDKKLGTDPKSLFDVCKDIDVLKYLIEIFGPNAENGFPLWNLLWNLLSYRTTSKDIRRIEVLLNSGADPNIVPSGLDPTDILLSLLIKGNNEHKIEIIKMLLKYGLSHKYFNDEVLEYLSKEGAIDIVEEVMRQRLEEKKRLLKKEKEKILKRLQLIEQQERQIDKLIND